MRPRRTLIAALLALAVVAPTASSTASVASDGWTWPLGSPAIDRDFAPPVSDYGAGHRGVDLPGTAGQFVNSVASGTVTFVGRIDGVPMVTVTHGGERSTYQPVDSIVTEGDAVDRGQPIGRLLAGHTGCSTNACLHLGRLRGDDYLDPTELMGGRYRLIDPDGEPPAPPTIGAGSLSIPVSGAITSAYGMRTHPVTGVHKLHDGIDFAAPCGTTVRAASAGIVSTAGSTHGYGLRVEVRDASGDATSYSHLSRITVRLGQAVSAGDLVGAVGTTGLSTGCHLHFSVHSGGTTLDPAPLL